MRRTLSDMGLLPKARKYQVFSFWAGIVGDVAKYARPRRLQGDVLFVATASSVWSQELYFMRESILAKINQALGGEHIKEIRFSEHMWSSTDSGPPAQETPALAVGIPSSEIGPPEGRESGIADPALAKAFSTMSRALAWRKQYFLSKGYRLCRVCGCVYPKEKTECPSCRLRREFTALTRAIAILDRRPETGDEEIVAMLDAADLNAVARARREVESRLVSFIRSRLAAGTRDAESNPGRSRRRSPERDASRAEVAEAVRNLASLRSGALYESMPAEDVEKAVGKRYAALARKG